MLSTRAPYLYYRAWRGGALESLPKQLVETSMEARTAASSGRPNMSFCIIAHEEMPRGYRLAGIDSTATLVATRRDAAPVFDRSGACKRGA